MYLPEVHCDHDDSRYPKRDTGRYHGIVSVHNEVALVGVVLAKVLVGLGGVPTEEYGREGNESWEDPYIGQHKGHGPMCHGDGILERAHYSVVAVDADTAQVEDRCRGEVDVQ